VILLVVSTFVSTIRVSIASVPKSHLLKRLEGIGSRAIEELGHDGYWYKGSLRLPDALDGTSIAPVVIAPVIHDWGSGTRIRVYYQTEDLSLGEHCYDNNEWYPGQFIGAVKYHPPERNRNFVTGKWSPGRVPGRSPISAVAFTLDDGGTEIQAYWRNLQDEIVVNKWTGSGWGLVTKVVGGIGSGFQFTLFQWERGKHLRLYYQNHTNVVLEHCTDDGADTWYSGSLQVGGIGQ